MALGNMASTSGPTVLVWASVTIALSCIRFWAHSRSLSIPNQSSLHPIAIAGNDGNPLDDTTPDDKLAIQQRFVFELAISIIAMFFTYHFFSSDGTDSMWVAEGTVGFFLGYNLIMASIYTSDLLATSYIRKHPESLKRQGLIDINLTMHIHYKQLALRIAFLVVIAIVSWKPLAFGMALSPIWHLTDLDRWHKDYLARDRHKKSVQE